MAEVLSQSQIDALLNAARSGEMDLAASAEKTTEKKYRKYDFYSPRKFTKDRMKMISGIFENYTRVINSRINGLLHTTCDVTVESVEEQRYYEFSNALSDGDAFTIHEEINGVLRKIHPCIEKSGAISNIAFVASKFNTSSLFRDYPQYDGHERRMSSNILEFECFHENRDIDDILIYKRHLTI